tara:strand:- start:1171 stop:1359 length:189 start_codon:yes stop_codon:yes gene_type:complete
MDNSKKYVKITKVDYFMHLLSKLNECYDKAIELGDEDTASAISIAEDTLMNTIKFEKAKNGI